MFSITKVELEVISDFEMYLLYEKRMRGGVSYISKRYSIANNIYLIFYDRKKPTNYIR